MKAPDGDIGVIYGMVIRVSSNRFFGVDGYVFSQYSCSRESPMNYNNFNNSTTSNYRPFVTVLAEIQTIENWIDRYKQLPYANQHGEGIRKKYDRKRKQVRDLNLEMIRSGAYESGKDVDESMICVLQESYRLEDSGLSSDAAFEEAKKPILDRVERLVEGGWTRKVRFTKPGRSIQMDVSPHNQR
jgi:hypothetical protein